MTEIISNTDQQLRISESDLAVILRVEGTIKSAITAGDPRIAFNYGRGLRRLVQTSGLALAKLLYELQRVWYLFQAGGVDDSFVTTAAVELGLSEQTVKKYSRMWESIFANPDISEEIKSQLYGKNVKTLLLLDATAREGIEPDKWREIAEAEDHQSVRNIVREIRGEQTSSENATFIWIDDNSGTLYCRRGYEGEREPFGLLNLSKMENSPAIQSAINRIIRTAGIMEI